MRRTTILAMACIAVGLGTVALAQTSYQPVPHAAWNFVGTTTTTHLGDAGVRVMGAACANEFPSSRMCTSREVLDSLEIHPFSSSDPAWVRPAFEPTSAGAALDASGLAGTPNAFRCGPQMTAPPSNLAVAPDGTFDFAPCDELHPVACCALIQVPEPSQNSGLAMGIAALSLLNRRRRSTEQGCAGTTHA